MKACPACGGNRLEMVIAADVECCLSCHHGARRKIDQPDYRAQAVAPSYDPARAEDQFRFLKPALQPGITAFELGCAAAELATFLRTQNTFARYDGLEVSPDVAKATHILDQVYSSWDQVPRAGRGYDLVIASHFLEHMEDIQTQARRFKALLAPEGFLFVEVPNRSGHPRLPFDTNPGHLHFFSCSSLTHLLADTGLEVIQVASGGFESMRYPDSLRVLARTHQLPATTGRELGAKLALPTDARLIVWGAGGMARELIAPFFPAEQIAYYVDRNETLWGQQLAGRPINNPNLLASESGFHVLISSIDYEAAIRTELKQRFGSRVAKVYGMNDLLT